MNAIAETWENLPPIPWDLEEVWLYSCPAVNEYLYDAFETAFGVRPFEARYRRFPDGAYVELLIDEDLISEHNVWGILMSTKLRRAGLDLSVSVRGRSLRAHANQ